MNLQQNGGNGSVITNKLKSPTQHTGNNTMDSFQDGGQQASEYPTNMEGPYGYMNTEMNNYGPGPGEQGAAADSYGPVSDGMGHPAQMSQYGYNRHGYNMENNTGTGSEFPNAGFGQYPQTGGRPGYPGGARPGMVPSRPVMSGQGMGPSGYSQGQHRMLSGQSIIQQGGPTPTLNQLLQTPNSGPRYPQNSYDGYSGPSKGGGDMGVANSPYSMHQSWVPNQRGMGGYHPQMPMSSGAPYRGQAPAGYSQNPMNFNQSVPPSSQYNHGSLQQQSQPPGQPPGSSPTPQPQPSPAGQQRPTPQPSPHQLSPAPSPSLRLTPNPSPGPTSQRPPPQPSPVQAPPSQPSPSPSQRSTSSQLSPPMGSSSAPHSSSQHNHLSSPKDASSVDDVKSEGNSGSSSLFPVPSPGSVGSRSNTPASVSGSSPMPPRPPSQQVDGQNNPRMSQSPMPAPGYNQQMMPPPMGPNQMGYQQGSKMAGMGPGPYPAHYNSQYPQPGGNYPVRQPGPGMGNYPQNMYNGPSQMQGPAGNAMYNNMAGGPGMNRNYGAFGGQGGMMNMNNQYGNYGGPGQMNSGQNSQGGPSPGMGSPGPSSAPVSTNSVGASSGGGGDGGGPMPGPPSQGQTPIKGAQAAAQAAMAAANAAARSQPSAVRPGMTMSPGPRMYGPQSMGTGPHSMPSQSMSPLSQMGQMNQMGYNSTMNSTNSSGPHPQNSVSPVPNAMGHSPHMGMPGNKMPSNFNNEQPLPKTKKSKSHSAMGHVKLEPNPDNICSPSVPDSNSSSHAPGGQQMPSSTPTSSLSDASNDSTSLGPVANSMLQGAPGAMNDHAAPTLASDPSRPGPGDEREKAQNEHQPIMTHPHTAPVETSATAVTQSITSPVTSISTETGNSNDSQSLPMDHMPMSAQTVPSGYIPMPAMDEPPEKKKKTEGLPLSQTPFARVAPSPGGTSVASIASSCGHDDVDNIGSPGWPGTPKASPDYLRLYDMGHEPDRRPFLDRLFGFLEEKGTPMSNMPVISKQPLDLYLLYHCVRQKGGMCDVTKMKKWKEVCGLVNISGSASAAFTLKKNYIKYMWGFECRYDRNGMDPQPVLNQMEAQLQQKREAKQRNRAPSPAGSQGSQDGMTGPGQFTGNNDSGMGHMGSGMMGNPMMNNMGPHGGQFPNNMGGQGMPHHMGMQPGPGYGPQGMMGGHGGWMPGGPNNMMGNSMGNSMGPQGGMMAPGMPNQSNMGNMPPHAGNMGPQSNSGMNMPPNNMGGNLPASGAMGNMPNNMGNSQPGAMMPGNNMSQSNSMGRNNIGQSMGPNNLPVSSSQTVSSKGESVTCLDPFADEPSSFSKQASGPTMPPFAGMPPSTSAQHPQSSSPRPPSSSSTPTAPPTNSTSIAQPATSTNSSLPQPDTTPSPSGETTATSLPSPQSSSSSAQGSMPPSSAAMPRTSSPAQQTPPLTIQNISESQSSSQGNTTSTTMSASSLAMTAVSPSTQDSQSSTKTVSEDQKPQIPPSATSGSLQSQGNRGQGQSMDSLGSSQMGHTTNTSSSQVSGRQFPFGDQFSMKSERFDQSSPGLQGQQNAAQPFTLQSQAPPMATNTMGNANTMTPPHMNQQMNQVPGDQMYPGRYGNQMPMTSSGQDQYGQGYPGGQSGYGPRPMMNPDQYPGYNQQQQGPPYNKPPMGREMSAGYVTPNKRYPDNRNDSYMSPAYNHRGYEPAHYTPSHPYECGVDNNHMDRQGQWSPMQQRYQSVPPYGPQPGMGPSGPPNMSHMPRMRMSPQRDNRAYTMSPNPKQTKLMQGSQQGQYFAGKRDHQFPPECVESTQPLLNKRRKLTRHDIGQIEAWRIMMALKSGLLAESTWALDTLTVLLYDDSTVSYFGLNHLPGLLDVLLDHFRRCLINMFHLFEDTEICDYNFKEDLMKLAIDIPKDGEIEIGIKQLLKDEVKDKLIDEKLDNRLGNTDGESNHGAEEKSSDEPVDLTMSKVDPSTEEHVGELEAVPKTVTYRQNYTNISRNGKEVKIDNTVDDMDDKKLWDVYSEFGDKYERWELGHGDLTEHIKTHFESQNEYKRCRQKFYRKPMKMKDPTEVEIKTEDKSNDEKMDSNSGDSHSVEKSDNFSEVSDAGKSNTESEDMDANDKTESSNEKSDNGSEKSDCSDTFSNGKDHTCIKLSPPIKTEPHDLEFEKMESTDLCDDDKLKLEKPLYEERVQLAVKYELLGPEELERTCKNQFGVNSEGERSEVEDESYQRNDPPLCLTSEARSEIGKRCMCISNIFRSLSCIPGNDTEMSRHPGLMLILGKLLLLHHKHLPRLRVRRKFDRDELDEDLVDTTQGVDEWWWDYLNVLRENAFVIFANICAQLQLDSYPDEICKPILEGLLHWAVCPSACATDPLPTMSPASVLTPQRLVLEAMCKLCIHDRNVDLLLATPPYERIVQLFSVLTKLLSNRTEQVTVEFTVVLLSELVQGGSSAARGVALQHPSISLLIEFLETAEQKAVQVVNMHSIHMLRDSPEMMGTSLDMLRRAATVLLHLAKVPENRKMFIHQQSRLLSLVMSQILDQHVAQILSEVLYHCS